MTEAPFTVTEYGEDDGIESFSIMIGYGIDAMWFYDGNPSTAQTVFGNPAVSNRN